MTCRTVVAKTDCQQSDHCEVPGLEQRPTFNVMEDYRWNEGARNEPAHDIDQQRNCGGKLYRDTRHALLQLLELLQQEVGCPLHYIIKEWYPYHGVANTKHLNSIQSDNFKLLLLSYLAGISGRVYVAVAKGCHNCTGKIVRIKEAPIIGTSVGNHGRSINCSSFNDVQQFSDSRITNYSQSIKKPILLSTKPNGVS